MYLQQLYLKDFRNYQEQNISFQAPRIILIGNNAQGKSNLLEAIELLSILKSNRNVKDKDLIKKNENIAQIKATLKRKYTDYELGLILRQKGKRTLTINGENVKRNLDFLGTINTVFFSSLDLDLVRGSPEYRRNWVDNILIQIEPIYASIMKEYTQVLRQRNALLKSLKKQENYNLPNNNLDPNLLLKIWNEKLAETGSRVTRRRARILNRITPLAQKWHRQISNETEILNINYAPNINWLKDDPLEVQKAIKNKIKERQIAEFNLGSTVVGPHRDDIEFSINDTPARSYASQGQQRTIVLSLKLAELQVIEQVIGETPLLLLDDVLAELDSQRQNHLLSAIGNHFQTIITTTHLNSFDANLLKEAQILQVKNGIITGVRC